MEGKERQKDEADYSRITIPGNLLPQLVLGDWKTSRSLHQPARIFQVYTDLSRGSVTYSVQIVSKTPYSFKIRSLDPFPVCGNGKEEMHSKDRAGSEEPLIAWV